MAYAKLLIVNPRTGEIIHMISKAHSVVTAARGLLCGVGVGGFSSESFRLSETSELQEGQEGFKVYAVSEYDQYEYGCVDFQRLIAHGLHAATVVVERSSDADIEAAGEALDVHNSWLYSFPDDVLPSLADAQQYRKLHMPYASELAVNYYQEFVAETIAFASKVRFRRIISSVVTNS